MAATRAASTSAAGLERGAMKAGAKHSPARTRKAMPLRPWSIRHPFTTSSQPTANLEDAAKAPWNLSPRRAISLSCASGANKNSCS